MKEVGSKYLKTIAEKFLMGAERMEVEFLLSLTLIILAFGAHTLMFAASNDVCKPTFFSAFSDAGHLFCSVVENMS